MSFVLALDQGTTSSRAIVFDHDGSIRAVARKEFAQIYPRTGWVEHDAREIWETQLAVAREVLVRAGLSAADVAAIGITNQRETTVLWDRKTGEPLGNAIVWQDRRTAEFCDELKSAGRAEMIQSRKIPPSADPATRSHCRAARPSSDPTAPSSRADS